MRFNIKTSLFNVLFALCYILIFNEIVVASPDAEKSYNSGLAYFEGKQYDAAIEQLQIAIKLEPENATYHHILARSYGREAESANWFRAMDLAKKTLLHLELAAKLDSDNINILEDLMDYYREAPQFLGGDTKKANEIESLIEDINSEEQESANL
jgi:tetratricopeptide (TPR) repeat protein